MNYRTYRTLFDTTAVEPAPIARSSDPITSHQSAAETEKKLGTLQWFCFEAIQTASHPITANEAARIAASKYGAAHESYRKRVHELVRNGLIEECGFRPCQITGKNAQTFKARSK